MCHFRGDDVIFTGTRTGARLYGKPPQPPQQKLPPTPSSQKRVESSSGYLTETTTLESVRSAHIPKLFALVAKLGLRLVLFESSGYFDGWVADAVSPSRSSGTPLLRPGIVDPRRHQDTCERHLILQGC